MKEHAHGDVMDAESFEYVFEGNTVTLMSADALHRELEQLHEAWTPPPGVPRPTHPLQAEERFSAAMCLQHELPPEPVSVSFVREAIARMPPSERWRLPEAIAVARDHLHQCPNPAPLFLVPAVWSVRMEQVLGGVLLPAQIGFWGTPF